MKTIWKYTLDITDRQEISMPKGARILSVSEQRSRIVLYAMVDTEEAEVEPVVLLIRGTGHDASEVASERFIGTVVIQTGAGPLVWHVFTTHEPIEVTVDTSVRHWPFGDRG